jgi:hypothetical protein
MWLIIPFLASGSAAELSAWRSALKSRYLPTGLSVWWSGKLRSRAELRLAYRKDRTLNLLGGMTLEPSMADHGVASYIASLRASLANLGALPESGREPMTPDGSGPISRASSMSPGLTPSGLKTSLASCLTQAAHLTDGIWTKPQMTLLGEWEPFSGTWPLSGSLRNGDVYERPMLEPPTDAAAFSSSEWRTPDAPGSGSGPRNRQASIGAGHQVTIAEQSEHWATPNAHDGTGARGKGFTLADHHYKPHDLVTMSDQWQTPATDSFRSRGAARKDEMGLDQKARLWATPMSRDTRSGETISDYGNARPLNEQATSWATPRAEDGESAGNHPNASDSLTGQTRFWKTPHGQGNRDASGKVGGAGGGEFSKQANAFQSSPLGQPTTDGQTCWCDSPGCARPSHKRKLNPIFETWLMGWPIWWLTSAPEHCGALAMASYLCRLRSRLSHLLRDSSSRRAS